MAALRATAFGKKLRMPTREDVDLARAAIDRGFLTIKESIRCLEIQRDHEKSGRIVPLADIFIEAKFLTEAQLIILKESHAKTQALRGIGHYEIMSKVGAGGMGTVYKAKDRKADRIVALKVLSPAHASNKEYIGRFLREARACGRLSHPNIVQGYDAGEANGQYYFAMEFVDGITVADMLKEGKPVAEQQALDIAIQIGKALEHAEEHNLIHRDIKPDNIMITRDGVAKLADLGLARLASGDVAQERRAFGTAYYASPEQCQGIEELGPKTDMYSFGATLFHMLAGRVPFDGETPEEIMAKHLDEKRPYLKDLNVQLSHGISKVVRKLMARDKPDRYASMSGVLKDLTLVRMGRSPKLGEKSRYDNSEGRYRSPTGSWRTKRPGNRQKVMQVSACVAVGTIMLVAGVLAFNWIISAIGPNAQIEDSPGTQQRSPEPAPKTEDAFYLEDLLAKGDEMAPEEFYDKLLGVAEKYPDTESAGKADALARQVLRKVEAAAKPVFEKQKSEALRLRDRLRYSDALNALKGFPEKYKDTGLVKELERLGEKIKEHAGMQFAKIKAGADELAEAKKFDEAVALYKPVIETFGLPELAGRAEAEIAKLNQAKTAEQDRLAREAEEKAREQERLEQAQEKERLVAAAIHEAHNLVTMTEFAEAAEKLKAIAADAIDENKPHLARAAADLDRLQKLFHELEKADSSIKGRKMSLVLRDGTKLEGKIFGMSKARLSMQLDSEAIKSVRWSELDTHSVMILLREHAGARNDPAEHCAIAAFLLFSGYPDDARAELDKTGADSKGKEAADLRRQDILFFEEKGISGGD